MAESDSTRAGAEPRSSSEPELDDLDDLLVRIHRSRQRPAYRRQVLQGITALDGIGGLRVLRAIERGMHAGDQVTVGDVATEMGIGHSTASRSVDDVCQRGLARKTACTDDLRKARLVLTDHGRTVLEQANGNRQQLLAQATHSWSGDDVETLTGLLARLLAGYDAVEADPGG